ncbi:tetraacyldisaccharide 4'-kinase [Tenacibaculum halocynthiae]|uniref:tetraacyldisaccharide 4'-kinase n=1 Tax=Tenacibaculum halocynthiae TaxID=1254437 RepID=UPI003D661D8C
MKVIRFLLFPIAVIYDIVTSIRNILFDKNFYKEKSFAFPIIAVGNLSVGGTGKSPQIEYLIRLLSKNYKLATLSRGYKRKTKGFQIVTSKHLAEDVGDEPLQFYKKFKNKITVAVDANRVNGIEQLMKQTNKPEVVLLDDAFQHRKVKASLYVLLTKYKDLYVNDYILPTGNLRESRRGAKRADIIIVTKCPDDLSDKEQKKIIKKVNPKGSQELFFTTISYDFRLYGNKNLLIDDLKGKEIVVVTGIANPAPFLQFLKSKNIKVRHLKFPDHHHFTKGDIEKIKLEYNSIVSLGKVILTTEKDFVRLENRVDNLFYLPIESSFLTNKQKFDTIIEGHVTTMLN